MRFNCSQDISVVPLPPNKSKIILPFLLLFKINFEIKESYKRGNGLLGVYIHNIKSINGLPDPMGRNPFDFIYFENPRTYFSSLYPTYDYVNDDGYNHLGEWIESAARKAGK